MPTNLYCIYDIVAQEIFGGIIRANNHEVARRAFHEALADQNSPIGKNPQDYTCLWLGTITTEDGIIVPGERVAIATGADWLAANKENAR